LRRYKLVRRRKNGPLRIVVRGRIGGVRRHRKGVKRYRLVKYKVKVIGKNGKAKK